MKPIETSRSFRGLAQLRRALGALGRLEIAAAVAAFAAAVLLNVVQIALRYLFGTSIWWAQEVSLLLMLIAYFVGTACVFRGRQYVVISFLVEKFPRALQIGLYIATQILILAFVVIVGYELIQIAPHMMRTRTVILRMPQYYMALPLLYACASILLTSIYYTLAMWWAARSDGSTGFAELEERIKTS